VDGEHGDPAVSDGIRTDGSVDAVGHGEPFSKTPADVGVGERVGRGVEAEVAQVVRFGAEADPADGRVDAVGADQKVTGPAGFVGVYGGDLVVALVDSPDRAGVAVSDSLAEAFVERPCEVAAGQAEQAAVK
jgi:hypothetical protein